MPIKFENVGIAVRDLEATIAFFTDLGLTVLGRDTVSGEWTDTAVGLDGNHATIAMLQTPDGNGRLELFEYLHPNAIETEPTRPNEIGMHRVAFSVDNLDEALEIAARHGCHPLRGVATYQDIYKLTYVRGPSGIIVMLAEELTRADHRRRRPAGRLAGVHDGGRPGGGAVEGGRGEGADEGVDPGGVARQFGLEERRDEEGVAGQFEHPHGT